ncbi:MAG TPA: hypothetical protein ENO21_04610, partial [Firmicutes bacterium]|nr:hypothetical protein [Bacillota bacterium]
MTPWNRLCVLSCACLLSAGCGGAGTTRPQDGADPAAVSPPPVTSAPTAVAAPWTGIPTLPAPEALRGFIAPAGPRETSYVPADLLQEGEAFAAGLPHQRVTDSAGAAEFSPDWLPADPDPDGLAYAM